MIALTRTRVVALAIVGVLVAAAIGWLVQGLAGEKALLSGASSSAGYELAPNGKAAKAAASQSSNSAPVVGVVGPDGKVKVTSGQGLGNGAGAYNASTAGSRSWDD